MTTINTTDDFIRLLRENPDFHAAARRELLTEELLELPQRFSQFALTTDRRLESLEKGQQRLESDVGVLKEDVGVLKEDVGVLKEDVGSLKNNVNALRGDALETKMPTRLCDLLSDALDIRRTQIFWMARHLTPPMSRSEHFLLTLEDATDRGIITDDEEARLFRTDMVIRSFRKSDGSHLWIAAEASGVIDQSDIDRARQSAVALNKAFGDDAIPVVYGYSIAERQREQAEATSELQQVHIFLEPDQPSAEH